MSRIASQPLAKDAASDSGIIFAPDQAHEIAHQSAIIADKTRFRTFNNPDCENIIYVNKEGHFWIKRAYERAFGDAGDFNGFNMQSNEARQLATEIRRSWENDKGRLPARLLRDNSELYARADVQIVGLAKTFEELADKHPNVVYVRGGRPPDSEYKTFLHEINHTKEGQFIDYIHDWFPGSPHADQIGRALEARGYGKEDHKREIIAHILAGQRKELGLTFDQATNSLDDYFSYVTFRSGREAMDVFKDWTTAPEMRETLSEAKKKYGPLPETGPNAGSIDGGKQPRLGEVYLGPIRRNEARILIRSVTAEPPRTERGGSATPPQAGMNGPPDGRPAPGAEQPQSPPLGMVTGRAENLTLAAKLYAALTDIHAKGTNNFNGTLEDAIGLARAALAEREKEPSNLSHPPDVQVMLFAAHTIAKLGELSTYNQSYTPVNKFGPDKGVNAFNGGLRLLTKMNIQRRNAKDSSIITIANAVVDVIGRQSPAHSQLNAEMVMIAGAAIKEVTAIRQRAGLRANEGIEIGANPTQDNYPKLNTNGHQKRIEDELSLGKAVRDKVIADCLTKCIRDGLAGKDISSNKLLIEHIKKDREIIVDSDSGLYAKIEGDQKSGYHVGIYKNGHGGHNGEGRQPLWSSDDKRVAYGANAEGRLTSLAEIQRTLNHFNIQTPVTGLAWLALCAKAAVKDHMESSLHAKTIIDGYKQRGEEVPQPKIAGLEELLRIAKEGQSMHVNNLEKLLSTRNVEPASTARETKGDNYRVAADRGR